jgi:hypothetical protein
LFGRLERGLAYAVANKWSAEKRLSVTFSLTILTPFSMERQEVRIMRQSADSGQALCGGEQFVFTTALESTLTTGRSTLKNIWRKGTIGV